MEYTERNGKYYIKGILQVKKTPDGWTIFARGETEGKTLREIMKQKPTDMRKYANTYSPVDGEHYDNVELTFERLREVEQ